MVKKTYRKTDIVHAVAKETRYSQREVTEILTAAQEEIKKRVVNGNSVNWANLGKFERTVRAARKGRNPATKEEMMVPESHSIHFTASAPWKRQVKSIPVEKQDVKEK